MNIGFSFMMDQRRKELLREDTDVCFKKSCIGCGTTKTPLWRVGPAGPKTLCNACGIRYRKKKMSMLGLTKSTENKRERIHTQSSTTTSASTTTLLTTNTSTDTTDNATTRPDNIGNEESVMVRFVGFGNEMMLQRSTEVMKKQRCQKRKEFGEEEQAAFLLMALSCGYVFA